MYVEHFSASTLPKPRDAVKKLLFCLRLNFSAKEMLQLVPKKLDRVEIGWFWWIWHGMFWVVILLEAMTVRECGSDGWKQSVGENLGNVELRIHNSLKHDQFSWSPLGDSSPDMYLIGCSGLPLRFGCSHFRWKLSLLWFSSRTEHSSVNITSLNCSFSRRQFSLNCRRLTQLGSQISWQYFVPVGTHPSFCPRRLTFCDKNCTPKCSRILLVSSSEVSSSLLSISASIKFISSIVMPRGGRPDLAAFSSDFVSWNLLKNLITHQWLIFTSSSARIFTIYEGPFPFDLSLRILVFCSCVRKPMVHVHLCVMTDKV